MKKLMQFFNDLASNSAAIKPYGPQLQNRWFKYDRVNNIFSRFFFFPRPKMGKNHAKLESYSVTRKF